MKHDIHQSISQGNYGADASQIGRMEEVANLLYDSSCKDETEPHSRGTYRGNLYSEQSIIEKYADEHHCWYTIDETFDFGGTIYPILAQPYIENATPALPEEIEKYMTSMGFSKLDDWTYQYKNLVLSDLKPKNVLKDELGFLFVIDTEIKEIK